MKLMHAANNSQINILVVDDEPNQRDILNEFLTHLGYRVICSDSPKNCLKLIDLEYFNLIITDLKMPEMDGIEFLTKIKQKSNDVGVIVVSAHGTIETAVDAMKKGADDFVQKPIEFEILELTVKKVLEKKFLIYENKKLSSENQNLKRELGFKYHISNTIGVSEVAKIFISQIEVYIQNNNSVLILGEAGSKEEDIARTIHYNSSRAANPLLFFDCKNTPEELQEVHLFGSYSTKNELNYPGLIEKAHLGTLVIANVNFLNRKCQEKLVSVVKTEKSQRLTSDVNYEAKIRLIATARQNEFDSWVNARLDLHTLLKQDILFIPSLRDRTDDIPILALALLKRLAPVYNRNIESIDKALLKKLSFYRFPGNYEELESIIESAITRCHEPTLKVEHLSTLIHSN